MIIKLLICDYHLKYVWYWSEDGEGKIGLEINAMFTLYSIYFYTIHLKPYLNTYVTFVIIF